MSDLLIDTEQGGSGTGVSYYMQAALCPRALKLKREQAVPESAEKTFKWDTGTCFHKIMELYHSGHEADIPLLTCRPEIQPALNAALKIFVAYKKKHMIDIWGNVIHSELLLPRDEYERNTLANLFGVPFTMRTDRIAVPDAGQVARLKRMFDLDLKAGGTYMGDYKVKWRRPSRTWVRR